jgi:hypothetical protein
VNSDDKAARFKAYDDAISNLGKLGQSLFVVNSDDEFDVFRKDFDEFLREQNLIPEGSSKRPYHIVRIGYDGDLLDDMFRLVVSDASTNFEPALLDASSLFSKQSIFEHLYHSITTDKFIVFHITEFPLAYYFETAVIVDVDELSNVMDSRVHDDTIMRYLKDLKEQGTEEHRKTYSFFYKISTSLLMELSNVFLVAPSQGLNKHIVVASWRTQTLLLGFSPLTWSSGSFRINNFSGHDITDDWGFPSR